MPPTRPVKFARTPRMAFGALRAGAAIGRDDAAAEGGYGSQSPGDWGSQGDVSNGNGGSNELATKEDLQGVHDSLSGQIGGGQGGAAQLGAGGMQDRNNAFQGGGSSKVAALGRTCLTIWPRSAIPCSARWPTVTHICKLQGIAATWCRLTGRPRLPLLQRPP